MTHRITCRELMRYLGIGSGRRYRPAARRWRLIDQSNVFDLGHRSGFGLKTAVTLSQTRGECAWQCNGMGRGWYPDVLFDCE